MALIIEDGTGIVGANSYISVNDCTVYLSDRGFTLSTGTYEPFLLRAMDTLAGLTYCGLKANTVNDLQFPRTDIKDTQGVLYGGTVVPVAIQRAQLWLAHYVSIGNDLSEIAEPAIKKEKVDVLETEFFESTSNRKIKIGDLPNVITYLRHLLANQSTSMVIHA